MSDKKIDGCMASHLMDAVEHLAKLELEMRTLKWRVCFRVDEPHLAAGIALNAKAQARKAMEALDRVAYRLEHGERDDKINAEQERAIRAVK